MYFVSVYCAYQNGSKVKDLTSCAPATTVPFSDCSSVQVHMERAITS